MTVVAVLKDKDDMIIGSDSMTTTGNLFIDKGEPKFIIKKIPCYEENSIKVVIGLAGNPTVNKYMEHIFNPPKYDKSKDFYKYLLDKFVPAFKELLKEKSYFKQKDKVPDNRSDILILHDNRIFLMHQDFDTLERKVNYTSIGSGREVAIGSLYSTERYNDSEKRMRKAIDAAINNTVYCDGKIWVEKVSKLIKEG